MSESMRSIGSFLATTDILDDPKLMGHIESRFKIVSRINRGNGVEHVTAVSDVFPPGSQPEHMYEIHCIKENETISFSAVKL
jgi:hypothetical protein